MAKRWYRWVAIAACALAVVLALRACELNREIVDRQPTEEVEANLRLQAVTLEQPDENGNLMWRLKAQAVNYSPDNRRAELFGLNGEFFQAGKTIYTVTADEGEVQQNGETLYLRGNLIATSLEDELTLKSEKLKWQPKKDLLMMGAFEDLPASGPGFIGGATDREDDSAQGSKGSQSPKNGRENGEVKESGSQPSAPNAADLPQLPPAELAWPEAGIQADQGNTQGPTQGAEAPAVTGFNSQLEAIAQLVTVSNKQRQVDLTGGVKARSREDPWLTFTSQALTWYTQQERLETRQPLTVEQYEGKDYKTVTGRLRGEQGEVALADNIVTLEKAVALELLDEPLKVQSEIARWQVDAQQVVLDKPVRIEQPDRQVTATANRAEMDLAENVILLKGDVAAKGEEKKARLNADQVSWYTESQDVEAVGNVTYQQAADPEIAMSGDRAVGNIEQGTVVVTGGDSGEVVTEIVPDDF